MVSVGTQTPWSWLSDHRISKAAVGATSTSDDLHLPEPCEAGDHRARQEKRETQELSLPSIVPPPDRERDRGHDQLTTDLSSEPRVSSDEGGGVSLPLPLAQIALHHVSSSDEHTSEGEEGEEGEGEDDITLPLIDKPAPYPDLCVGQISWPAILQYLRESESEASKYFSIDEGDKRMKNYEQLSVNNEEIVTERKGAPNADMGPVVEGMSRECDFCGQAAAQWSMLSRATGDQEVSII